MPAAPGDVHQIKLRLQQLLGDAGLRRRLARLAVLRSLDFRWKKTAAETFACYERSIQARSAKPATASLGDDSDSAGPRTEAVEVGGKRAAA